MSGPTTTDRLRADIDSGRLGDKVPAADPAAAPLGTDAEAAGYPPTRQEIEMAARPMEQPRPRGKRQSIEGFPWLYLAIALPVALAVLVSLALALAGRPS